MRLQTDPTVIYGLGARFDGNLRKRDLEADTPYNTYTRDGLPPTPIALPGQASLDAVDASARRPPYLYFVARGDGIERILGEPRRSQSRRGKIPEGRALTRDARRRSLTPLRHVPTPPAASSRSKASTAPARARTSPWLAERIARAGHASSPRASPAARRSAKRCATLLLREPMTHDSEALLMFAARREHLERVIRPALARGDWVLCDRFTDATYAYQGGGHGVPLARIRELEQWIHGDCQPDLTFLFDVPTGVSRARLDARAGARAATLDKFEREASAFFERVRGAYLERARADPRPLPHHRQHAAARRRACGARSASRRARGAGLTMARRARRRGRRALPWPPLLPWQVALAARCCLRGARPGRTRCWSTVRAASASTRWRSTSRRRCCASRRGADGLACGVCPGCRYADRRPASRPDAARAPARSTRRPATLEGGRHDRDRPRARADRLRAADEPSAAREGRGDRPGRADERGGRECAAEDARGAARRAPF